MITDQDFVELLGRKKEKENLEFQVFLKHVKIDITPILMELYMEVWEKIDCRTCARCCKKLKVTLSSDDVQRLSSCLDIGPEDLKTLYLTTDLKGDYTFKSDSCPFLVDNECSCYLHRPNECVSYPHLDSANYIFKLKTVLVDCSLCPIVYNVFEELKKMLGFQSAMKQNAGVKNI
ncbi:MAG: YkgJ family cysteine cluster protein [Archaeoglobaceae archaeon]